MALAEAPSTITRSRDLSNWRGTPEEVRSIAGALIDAMETVKETSQQRFEHESFRKFEADVSELERTLNIDPANIDPNDSLAQFYQARVQELWHSTQHAIATARPLLGPAYTFAWKTKGGEESDSKPDIFSDERLPRDTVGIIIRGNVFGQPSASINVQLQNWPYALFEVEVSGNDWVWVEATLARLFEVVRRAESGWTGFLYRPVYGLSLSLLLWFVYAVYFSELVARLPLLWFREREWIGVFIGYVAALTSGYGVGWLYPRFQIVRSVAREQTEAVRIVLLGVIAAVVVAVGQWLLRILE